MHFTLSRTIPLLALFSGAIAQTFTDCNPLNGTCPPNTALGVANYTIDFQQSLMSSNIWNTTSGKIRSGDDGALFTINQKGDAPTTKTRFYIFFGQLEVIMKAAKGQGVVSSIVMQSDDLDEVDWEWIGGNDSYVQTNYFGKGDFSTYDRAVWHPVSNPQDEWHNYTVDWSREKLDWYIDGQLIRTLKYEDAKGGTRYPQTPCDVRLGIWAGGDPKNPKGTIEWSGGEINYDDTPFTMTVKSVRVSDASRGTQYIYGDDTGSMESIRITNDAKPIDLNADSSDSAVETAKHKWNGLSHTNKIIVISVVCGVVGICVAVFAFCCIRQRRAGKQEKLVEDAKFEKDTSELLAYRAQMSRLRSEKLAEARMNNVSAFPQPGFNAQTSSIRSGVNPGTESYSMSNYGYANNSYASNNNYAPSVNTYNSGRGYQRY